MGALPTISIAPVAALGAATEVALLGAAQRRDPGNAALLGRLVELLLELDRFDEAIAILAPQLAALDFEPAMALTKACLFTREADPAKAALALRASEAAIAMAANDSQRARALAEQGKALFELGREQEASVAQRRAFALDPGGAVPLKRLVLLLLRERGFAELAEVTARLCGQGVNRTDVLAARVLALAGLGEAEAARDLAGAERFARNQTLDLPPGWPDLAAFNTAVAAEIRASPELRFGRFATASRHTWRVDAPARGSTPAIDALLGAIAAQAARRLAELPDCDHPWLAARPRALTLKCWAVITEAEGFERWHFHPAGWMSGGYYPDVPAAVAASDDPAGCFAFGLPARYIGAEAAAQFGEQLVRPYAGMLSLFPSQAQHSTYPHGAEGQRICLAFDLCPG